MPSKRSSDPIEPVIDPRARFVARAVGCGDGPLVPIHGGDTCQIWSVGDAVIKVPPKGSESMVDAESLALHALAARRVSVPQVRGKTPHGLALLWVPTGPPRSRALGRAIAHLHQQPAPSFGWEHPTWIGRVALRPAARADLSTWLLDDRIAPLTQQARPTLGPALADAILAVARRFPLPGDGPHLIHGDLWSGNVLHGVDGPVFIDPSCPFGHRGLDPMPISLAETDRRTPDTERKPRKSWWTADLRRSREALQM